MVETVKPQPHALDGLIQTSVAFQLLKPFTGSIKTVISVDARQELLLPLKYIYKCIHNFYIFNAESIKSFNNSPALLSFFMVFVGFDGLLW